MRADWKAGKLKLQLEPAGRAGEEINQSKIDTNLYNISTLAAKLESRPLKTVGFARLTWLNQLKTKQQQKARKWTQFYFLANIFRKRGKARSQSPTDGGS